MNNAPKITNNPAFVGLLTQEMGKLIPGMTSQEQSEAIKDLYLLTLAGVDSILQPDIAISKENKLIVYGHETNFEIKDGVLYYKDKPLSTPEVDRSMFLTPEELEQTTNQTKRENILKAVDDITTYMSNDMLNTLGMGDKTTPLSNHLQGENITQELNESNTISISTRGR